MAIQYLNGTVVGNINNGNDRDRMQTALDNATNQLTNNTKHTFYSYGPNDHNWDCPGLNKPNSVDVYLEDNFSNALKNAENAGDISVVQNDIWILMDLADKYGYGDGGRKADDFNQVWVNRAISFEGTAFVNDPNETVKKVIKHNLGHSALAEHRDGNYQFNSNNEVDDISPMAWSYIEIEEDCQSLATTDACSPGSGNEPDNFNDCIDRIPKDQYIDCNEADGRACACTQKCHHKLPYSVCSERAFELAVSNRN